MSAGTDGWRWSNESMLCEFTPKFYVLPDYNKNFEIEILNEKPIDYWVLTIQTKQTQNISSAILRKRRGFRRQELLKARKVTHVYHSVKWLQALSI